MVYEVTTRTLPRQVLVTIRSRVPQGKLPGFIGDSFGRIFSALPTLRATPVGAPFLIYHDFGPDEIEAEACVPVDRTNTPEDPLSAQVQRAGTVAVTLHVGPYAGLRFAYEALTDWIANHGYRQAGPIRERYLTGPGDRLEPSEYRTEMEVPIESTGVRHEARPPTVGAGASERAHV